MTADIPTPEQPERMFNETERELDRVESAWARAALAFRTGHRPGHGRGSVRGLSLISVHERLEGYRARVDAGDTLEILHAIAFCAQENVPLPTWLAGAFLKQLDAFVNVKGWAASLDSVFKSDDFPTNTPEKAAAARADWQRAHELWGKAQRLVLDDHSIASWDAVFTALAGRDVGIGKTTIRRLVRDYDKRVGQEPGLTPLSQILKIRRKESR